MNEVIGIELKVVVTPHKDLAYTNVAYVSTNDFKSLVTIKIENTKPPNIVPPSEEIKNHGLLVIVGGICVFSILPHQDIVPGTIGLNALQRKFLNSPLDKSWSVKPFDPPQSKFFLSALTLEVSLLVKTAQGQKFTEIDCKELAEEIKRPFSKQVFQINQTIALQYQGKIGVTLRVTEVSHALIGSVAGEESEVDASKSSSSATSKPKMFDTSQFSGSIDNVESKRGMLLPTTDVSFIKGPDAPVVLKGQPSSRSVSRILDVDFEKLGIGGLDKEFSDIFRRAFASRIFPPDVVKNMGINHVRGMILYGPPGCGKTLIARQISKVLQGDDPDKAREPKIVNGPEILSKFVGESEKNIRELFADAEEEQERMGDESELHVIILDEFDAIAKARGSNRDGTGVHDSLVNQLLSKIDGVEALNNILLIGMTNRLDMIDPALLRPGRFEIPIEIGLPDEKGRVQILSIHTRKMKNAGYLDDDVSIVDLAARTKNFTGAEIEGLVKNAASYAFQRQVDFTSATRTINPQNIRIHMSDFEAALAECKPAFGVSENEELKQLYSAGILDFSDRFIHVEKSLSDLCIQVQTSERSQLSLVSVLLSGPPGSGKTALAAKLAYESQFPFVRIISPDSLIGMSEQSKSSKIATVFDEAYRSSSSLVILDDIERLMDFSRVGPRFSNLVLQTLLILIKKGPPKGRRLMIVATTSSEHDLKELDVTSVFNVLLHVPQVEDAQEMTRVIRKIYKVEGEGDKQNQDAENGVISQSDLQKISEKCSYPISIKKLLLVLEMARPHKTAQITYTSFMEALFNAG